MGISHVPGTMPGGFSCSHHSQSTINNSPLMMDQKTEAEISNLPQLGKGTGSGFQASLMAKPCANLPVKVPKRTKGFWASVHPQSACRKAVHSPPRATPYPLWGSPSPTKDRGVISKGKKAERFSISKSCKIQKKRPLPGGTQQDKTDTLLA